MEKGVFKKLVYFLFIITLSCTPHLFAHADIKCEKLATLAIFETSNANLKTQLTQIENYLQQGITKDFPLTAFFGHNFDLSKTDEKIKQIEDIIHLKGGLPAENQSLEFCLRKLHLDSYLETLANNSIQLHKNKILLLKKNLELDDSIRTGKIAQNELPNVKEKIERENKESLITRSELESNLIKKESEANKEKDNSKKDYLNYEGELTKSKIQLLDAKIKSNQILEEKIKRFEKSSATLDVLSTNLNSNDPVEIIKSVEELEVLWLELSKENYTDFIGRGVGFSLPTIPDPLESPEDGDLVKDLNKQREDLIVLRNEIRKELSQKRNYEIKILNQVITSSNSLRSNLFYKTGKSYFFRKIFSLNSYILLRNELISSPHRLISYFNSKYLYIQENLSLGKPGYVNLIFKIGQVLLLAISFFTFKLFFARFNNATDRLLHRVLIRSKGSFFTKRVISLWHKLKDNSIHFLWLLVLYAAEQIEILNDLSLIIDIAKVFLYANILKSIITLFLGSVSKLDLENFSRFKIKANETSNKFKNIFMFYCLTMIFIEATVGRVYLYTLLNYVVLFYSIYNIIQESSEWEEEFRRYSEKKFSGVVVEKYFNSLTLMPSKFRAISVLIFILIFMIFDILIGYTENFQLSKKISANLFKKQIEKVEAADGSDEKIPQSYKNEFSLKSLNENKQDEYVQISSSLEPKILAEINKWSTEKSGEHSLVIYGEKGIGKTTLLKIIASKIMSKNEIDVRYVKLPPKTIDEHSIQKFISGIFGHQIDSEEFDLDKYDQKLEKKTIVIIDETQNIFLSHIGGFEAFNAFVHLVNLNTLNIFWVMSFNKYSWLYLDRAFGRTQYFRNVFELKGWSDLDIKELIMKRHLKTGHRLSYDLLISATRSQDEIDRYASVESKFFKLLWELSNGNPRAALNLWISALSRKGKNIFNVNVPKEAELDGVEKLSDDLMFVVASVLKHENLTFSEIESTTDLPSGIIRNSIKQGLEQCFFYEDERKRYMVEISTQHGMIRRLKLKNFIYGS